MLLASVLMSNILPCIAYSLGVICILYEMQLIQVESKKKISKRLLQLGTRMGVDKQSKIG